MRHPSFRARRVEVSVFEGLEPRRLFCGTAADEAAELHAAMAAATASLNVKASASNDPTTNTGGVGTTPIAALAKPEPTTILETAGRTYFGSVGRLKNVLVTGKLFARIDWGDGSTSTGEVQKISAGVYQINGKHSYKYGGTYAVDVSVFATPDCPPGQVCPFLAIVLPTIHSKAKVEGPAKPDPLKGTGVSLDLTAGTPFSGKVASFTYLSPTASNAFSATIDWGDNTVSAGTVVKSSIGSYLINGKHTYANAGKYIISIAVANGTKKLGTIESSAAVSADPNSPGDGVVKLTDGVLSIVGTSKDDSIKVTQNTIILNNTSAANGSTVVPADRVTVNINGHVHIFASSAVKSLTVDGSDGNDTIDLNGLDAPVPIPVPVPGQPIAFPFSVGVRVSATIHGGKGNDTINGGNAADTIYGDAGNDKLRGGLGMDVLRGGDNDDLLISTFGPDQAYGGAGNDTAQQTLFKFGTIGNDVEHVV